MARNASNTKPGTGLKPGQARADQLIRSVQVAHLGRHLSEEVRALRATVRNLCSEVAMYENDDGTVSVEHDGITYGVMLTPDRGFDFAQINGIDVSRLLSVELRGTLTTRAIDRLRDEAIEAYRTRYAA